MKKMLGDPMVGCSSINQLRRCRAVVHHVFTYMTKSKSKSSFGTGFGNVLMFSF